VIGADTLERFSNRVNTARICKIRKTGAVYVAARGFLGLDAFGLASKVITNSRGIVAAARHFADLGKTPLEEAMRMERQQDAAAYKIAIGETDPVLTVLFADIEDGLPTFAVVTFSHSSIRKSPMEVHDLPNRTG
jgi:hypothetical protein